jgi:hypothetical protein
VIITVVATLCHALAAIPQPVCREEIIARTDTMGACLVGQPAVAAWKSHSIFRSDAWSIARIRCIPGDYQGRDSI